MGSVSAPRRRRHSNFDFAAKRRQEIVWHARHVGAMDTEDRERWLVAYALHNPAAKDQVWGVMLAAEKMGGEITRAEAIAIVDEANAIPRAWGADRLAKHLALTYQQRTLLGITTIGACDFSKRQRKQQRKHKARMRKERMRRAGGVLARAEYEANSVAAKARAEGVSRMTIYRRRKRAAEQAKNHPEVTGVSAAIFLSCEDGPVTPAGVEGTSERRCRAEERKEDFRLATATTMAADAPVTSGRFLACSAARLRR